MGAWFESSLRFIIFVGLYLAGAWLATLFLDAPDQVTLIWPSAGLALAVLLLFGMHWWPFIAVSVLLLHLFLAPVPWLFVPFSIMANTVGALLGAWWVQRFYPQVPTSLRVRYGFAVLGGALILALSAALIGSVGLTQAGMVPTEGLGVAAGKWMLGDLFGCIAVTPAVMLIVQTARQRGAPPLPIDYPGVQEKAVWALALTGSVGVVLLAGRYGGAYALGVASLPLALLLWSALRFEAIYTAVATMALALFVTSVAGLGLGGFTPPTGLIDSAILLAFMCVNAGVPQLVAAASHENRVAALKLFKRATTDPLTGLPNRTAFEDTVRALLDFRRAEPMALAYLDLDQFKVVNDIASHAAGDELIRELSGLLRAELNEADVLARTGGDEFALLIRRCSPGQIDDRLQHLRQVVGSFRLASREHLMAVTVSIGAVPFRAGRFGFDALLAQADAACFTAKELGGNRVVIADPGRGEVHERTVAMRWVMRLNRALEHDGFHLHCQPIAALKSNEGGERHFEVLLRMRDPDSGELLMPGQFVSAAERFGLGVRLDRYVVDRTLAWLEKHPQQAGSVGMCAINLSAGTLMDVDFLRFLRERLARSSFAPERLCFEITETSVVRDLGRALEFIREFRAMGCRFALDDFGTGFCSFAYLESLDVDFLKIDGSFVREAHRQPLALAIVRSIAEIARVMRKQTIAESVESEALIRQMQALDVDYIQGYAIGRPQPIAEYFAEPPLRRMDGVA
jgi:diguanylate cyclase (GGDEF)-like protein